MDFTTYYLINVFFFSFIIVTTAFYMFCMVFPLPGERIKQPLKLLLGSFICCTTIYMVSIIVVDLRISLNIFKLSYAFMVSSVSMSITSSVWLNFFYCCQIVPAKRAFFIWIKKNVKSIIYCIWFTERIYSLLDFTCMYFLLDFGGLGFSNNVTELQNRITENDVQKYFREDLPVIVFSILNVHFIFCLCVMLVSNGSIVLYLGGHMRRMVAHGQSLSCPQLRNQLRVTVTGILQGAMYTFCAIWTVFFAFSEDTVYYSLTDSTVTNLYMSGTLFCLGVGQAVFRQRAAHIWLRAAQWCKAPRVQPSEEEEEEEEDAEAQTRRPGLC